MDGTAQKLPKDRAFEPSKIPLSEDARSFVVRFVEHLSNLERRKRARKSADQALHIKMATAIALDLAHRELSTPGEWLTVSLERGRYLSRVRSAPFLTQKFPDLLKVLATDTTFVDFSLGAQGSFGTGTRSIIRAGRGLRSLIEESELCLSDIGRDRALQGDAIVLKGRKVAGKARKLVFTETDDTHRMRAEVDEINDWLAGAELWWAGDEVEDRVDTGERHLRRIFNEGCFESGGRLFGGFWQRAKSDARLDCTVIGGQTPSALDFGQMAVRIAYSMQGAALPDGDDLYYVPSLERFREGVKRVLNALLAADRIPQRFPQGCRKFFPRNWSFAEVRAAIEAHHSALKPLFGTGQALRIMKAESDLLVVILLRLKKVGVVALPIHDCVLVSQKDETIAQSVMEDSFREVLGVEGSVVVIRSTTTIQYLPIPSNTFQYLPIPSNTFSSTFVSP